MNDLDLLITTFINRLLSDEALGVSLDCRKPNRNIRGVLLLARRCLIRDRLGTTGIEKGGFANDLIKQQGTWHIQT